MNKQYGSDLEVRLPGGQVPQVFAKGEHLGGFDDVFNMNERGELMPVLQGFKVGRLCSVARTLAIPGYVDAGRCA